MHNGIQNTRVQYDYSCYLFVPARSMGKHFNDPQNWKVVHANTSNVLRFTAAQKYYCAVSWREFCFHVKKVNRFFGTKILLFFIELWHKGILVLIWRKAWMTWYSLTLACWATTDNTSNSMRLNSSKQAHAPAAARPLKNCIDIEQ